MFQRGQIDRHGSTASGRSHIEVITINSKTMMDMPVNVRQHWMPMHKVGQCMAAYVARLAQIQAAISRSVRDEQRAFVYQRIK